MDCVWKCNFTTHFLIKVLTSRAQYKRKFKLKKRWPSYPYILIKNVFEYI